MVSYKSRCTPRSDHEHMTMRLSIILAFLMLGLFAVTNAGLRTGQDTVTDDDDDGDKVEDDQDEPIVDEGWFGVASWLMRSVRKIRHYKNTLTDLILSPFGL